MSDTVAAAWKAAIDVYKGLADQRRVLSRHDVAADTLEYVVADMQERLRAVDGPSAVRTVEQYATDHGVSMQTVRNWIHRGELQAVQTPHGWRIPRSAVRRRRKTRPEEKAA